MGNLNTKPTRVIRFCSRAEAVALMNGETIYNDTNHSAKGRSSTSIGCCFADKNPDTSSLWHDKKEEPINENVSILYVSRLGNTDITVRFRGIFDYCDRWEQFAENNNIDKWAYISDLLPKGSEK